MRPHPVTVAAAALVGLEGLATLILAGIQVQAMAAGDVAEIESAVALLALTIVMGIGILAFAWGILRGRTWGRSGGIVTQVLIASIGFGAATGLYAHPLQGFAIVAPAVLGFILIIASARRAPDLSHAPSDELE